MAKQLLADYRPGPPAQQAKNQQRGFRDSAPGFAGRHFVGPVDEQRQHAGEQAPTDKRVGQESATCGGKDQQKITEVSKAHKAATA